MALCPLIELTPKIDLVYGIIHPYALNTKEGNLCMVGPVPHGMEWAVLGCRGLSGRKEEDGEACSSVPEHAPTTKPGVQVVP